MCMNEMVDWSKIGGETRRIKFVIPVGNNKKWWQFWKKSGTSVKDAEKQIQELISLYKEDINFDEKSGEVNMSKNSYQIPNEYWFPSPQNDDADITITLDENGNIVKKNNDKI